MQLDRSTLKKIGLLAAALIVLVWGLFNYEIVLGLLTYLWGLVFPFILGLIFAFLLNIPMRNIEKWVFRDRYNRLRRPVSFILSIVAILLVLGLAMFIIIPQLAQTIVTLVNAMPGYMKNIQNYVEPYLSYIPQLQQLVEDLNLDWASIVPKITSFLSSGAGNFLSSAVGVATSVVGGAISFFVGLIFACYVVLDKEHLAAQTKGLMRAYLPDKAYKKILEVAAIASKTFTGFVTGQCMEALALGVIFAIILSVGGFNYALLIAVLIALFSLIPIFGATIACILGALLLLMSQGFWRALIFVIIFLVVQQIDGNFMYPHIVGSTVGLPPMWVLVAVTLGGSLMGLSGMFFFIPLVSVVYTLVRRSATARLRKKGIPIPSEDLAASRPPPTKREKRKKKNK